MNSKLGLIDSKTSYREEYDKECDEKKIWPYIGSPVAHTGLCFRLIVDSIFPTQRVIEFLDIGAGAGNVLAAVTAAMAAMPHINPEEIRIVSTSGVEINKDLAFIAQSAKFDVLHQDALTLHKSLIRRQNIIHYYQPIRDKTLMTELERKIEDEMQVGAVLMANFKVDNYIQKDKRFERINFPEYRSSPIYRMYRKVADGKVKRPRKTVEYDYKLNLSPYGD